jgi:hypothetical protein
MMALRCNEVMKINTFGGLTEAGRDTMVATENRRYAAMLLFQFRVLTGGESNKRRLCEKRLILLEAQNGRAALRAAKRRGRTAQHKIW